MEENDQNIESTKKSKKLLYFATACVLLLLVVGGVFLLSRSKNQTETLGSQTQTLESNAVVDEEANESASESANESAKVEDKEAVPTQGVDSAVRVVNVEGGSFYYKPNIINAKVGEKIKVVFASKDMRHDFVIDELNVRTQVVSAGQTASVEFTPTQAGTFEFYCSVANHRAQGMVGKLIVTK